MGSVAGTVVVVVGCHTWRCWFLGLHQFGGAMVMVVVVVLVEWSGGLGLGCLTLTPALTQVLRVSSDL